LPNPRARSKCSTTGGFLSLGGDILSQAELIVWVAVGSDVICGGQGLGEKLARNRRESQVDVAARFGACFQKNDVILSGEPFAVLVFYLEEEESKSELSVAWKIYDPEAVVPDPCRSVYERSIVFLRKLIQ